jgi:hypothetical protein
LVIDTNNGGRSSIFPPSELSIPNPKFFEIEFLDIMFSIELESATFIPHPRL